MKARHLLAVIALVTVAGSVASARDCKTNLVDPYTGHVVRTFHDNSCSNSMRECENFSRGQYICTQGGGGISPRPPRPPVPPQPHFPPNPWEPNPWEPNPWEPRPPRPNPWEPRNCETFLIVRGQVYRSFHENTCQESLRECYDFLSRSHLGRGAYCTN